ncbi:hypothetical protein SPRG_06499 [Saprolegnia parasitica CBS 223.65]|uniref:Uncharacterized protein n=1 Tax=Saprolegnia parasitica (strain CBS 223.65) TaxID=695850 RepID=A0A067CHI5_SAPPC|nr:hypothetical protein SPRG_06499 [Saprolegnia parasitica CBS 223.65]KDO28645.1 hypothetical protein SPRG_06499 [Saprolegnia parasitica CBS 223.65]|eukprot:XP_012200706.1 hypothetical protein SPRG_06499 [Saprolegnia parasitica CBS 223.65]
MRARLAAAARIRRFVCPSDDCPFFVQLRRDYHDDQTTVAKPTHPQLKGLASVRAGGG